MSLLDSLNSPKWQHKNPQVRIDAIEDLNDQAMLCELVTSDPDASVQSAALARISTPFQFRPRSRVLRSSLPGTIRRLARKTRSTPL